VGADVDYAYARTVDTAQGATVDHSLFTPSAATSAERAYVALSRGRISNRVYATTDRAWVDAIGDPHGHTFATDQHPNLPDDLTTRRAVLQAALASHDAPATAGHAEQNSRQGAVGLRTATAGRRTSTPTCSDGGQARRRTPDGPLGSDCDRQRRELIQRDRGSDTSLCCGSLRRRRLAGPPAPRHDCWPLLVPPGAGVSPARQASPH
jgi:hypothetical protein